MLYVSDMEKSVRFYCDVLGFEVENRVDGWASLKRGVAEVMLSLPNEHIAFEKPKFTGSFYFHTQDVDALWEKLRDRAPVVYPIENFEYGMREFAIEDVIGYVLQFGQKL